MELKNSHPIELVYWRTRHCVHKPFDYTRAFCKPYSRNYEQINKYTQLYSSVSHESRFGFNFLCRNAAKFEDVTKYNIRKRPVSFRLDTRYY